MARIKIGEATTDSNGVATFTYEGTGAGKLNVRAEYGTLLSETYEVFDTLFYDKGHSGTDGVDYNSTGWTNARCTLTRDTETKLVWDGTSNNGAYYRSFTLNDGLCIEFDINFVKNSSSHDIFNIEQNWTVLGNMTKSNCGLAENTWHHIQIEMQGANGTIKNDTNDTVISFDCTGADRFLFSLRHSNDVIMYKNFKIYSI